MRNFGEELAYWYLRLNGFFLIDDFVLHSADLESSQSADADVIGIRNPFTVEMIGMHEDEDICLNLLRLEPAIKTKTVVVISEIKTSPQRQPILLEREDRLKYIVKRTGLFESKVIDEVSNHLFENNFYSNEKITILKIIFSQFNYENDRFHCLQLSYIDQYIKEKFLKYLNSKDNTKHLFPSTLMQYLIWRIKEENVSRDSKESERSAAVTDEEIY